MPQPANNILIDICCKAGGASRGYQQAGFYVIGVDKDPQPHYVGDEFIQSDITTLDLPALAKKVGAIAMAGSPPCQFFSELTPPERKSSHPNLIPYVRKAFLKTGLPYVIENVEGARTHLINPLMLCGSMFDLPIWRHRFFENNFDLFQSPAMCNHGFIPVLVSGTTRRKGYKRVDAPVALRRESMGIDWTTAAELDEAIPPAYTRFIGLQLMNYLEKAA